MSALAGLWLVSLALSGIAIAIMIGLILARAVNGRRGRRREVERKRLIPMLLTSGPGAESAEFDSAPGLVADVSTELIQMVRGTDKENFVARSARLGVPERLRDRLDHGSPRARLAAAEALAHFSDEISIASLQEAVNDKNADVRLAAAMALASAGHAPPVKMLIDMLGIGTEENSMLVVGLFQEIAATRPDEISELVDDDDSPAAIKAAAIEALSTSGDYRLVPRIVALAFAADPNDAELPRYLRALGDFGHPAAAPAIRHALGSPSWWVRAAAAEAAGRIALSDMSDRLGALLADENWWVRFRAGEALLKLGDSGRACLDGAAAGGVEPARSAARLTLAEQGLS